jgi:hypothetical protein
MFFMMLGVRGMLVGEKWGISHDSGWLSTALKHSAAAPTPAVGCAVSYEHQLLMRVWFLLVLATLPLMLGASGAQPSVHEVLLARGRTEPAVAIDRVDPLFVVAGANTDYGAPVGQTFPVPFFASHDGGRSFNSGLMPLVPPYTTAADSSVAIDPSGTAFYAYLAESPTYCSQGPAAILLSHSRDRGISFLPPTVVDSQPNDDRPTLAAESFPGHFSHLFVAWDRSYPDHSEVWIARSVDGGATFNSATKLYSSAQNNFAASPLIGPHGRVYVVWLRYSNAPVKAPAQAQVLVTASADDGVHFGPVRGAGPGFATLPQLAEPGGLRDLTVPAAVVSPAGAVYVAYAAVSARHQDGSVDADILLRRSRDQGNTWSAPERINDVGRADRFMPALSVLADGSLGIAFYDRRASAGELDVYAARASYAHGFEVTANVKVNSAPSPVSDIAYFKQGRTCFPSGRFFGDYIGTAADRGALAVVWADTQLHQPNETDVWFARVTLPSVLPAQTPQARPPTSAPVASLPVRLRRYLRGIQLFGLSGTRLLLVLTPVIFLLLMTLALAIATWRASVAGLR